MFKKDLGVQLMTDPSEFDISFDADSNHYTYKRLGTITAADLLPTVPVGLTEHLLSVVPVGSSSSDLLSSSASSMIVPDQLFLTPPGGHLQEQARPGLQEPAATATEASNMEVEVDQGIVYVLLYRTFY